MNDALHAALERLSRVPGVDAALVADLETGLPVAAELAHGASGPALAAFGASLFRRAGRAAQAAALGRVRRLQLAGARGDVVVAGSETLAVVALVQRGGQLGLARLEASRAAEALP